MVKLTRRETIERCKKIVEEHEVRTQADFAKFYADTYGDTISQTKVHRMFKVADISMDFEEERYMYKPEELVSDSDDTDEILYDVLSRHLHDRYTHEKGVPSMLISVDVCSEQIVAKSIYDYCEGKISILCGFGCLWLRCRDNDTYIKLKRTISKYEQ